jgi:hypothetical protein
MKINANRVFGIALCAALGASSASAIAANPRGSGQPGAPLVTCGTAGATNEPPGFSTGGFSNAGNVYAGSPGTPSLQNGNPTHAISQYDIACFQRTQNNVPMTNRTLIRPTGGRRGARGPGGGG